jgi:hypothetical protein
MLHADGPSALWALEPVLTEMANDRVLGGVTAMLLVSVAARAALTSSALELDADAETVEVAGPVLDGAVSLVEDLLAEITDRALRRP